MDFGSEGSVDASGRQLPTDSASGSPAPVSKAAPLPWELEELESNFGLNLGELLRRSCMGSRRRGSGRRKVGRKKRRMRSKIRHRKG